MSWRLIHAVGRDSEGKVCPKLCPERVGCSCSDTSKHWWPLSEENTSQSETSWGILPENLMT